MDGENVVGNLESDIEMNDEVDEEREEQTDRKARSSRDVYIAEGVYTDCNNILNAFLKRNTSTFEDFVVLWKERKFVEIYFGKDTFGELVEFSQEVLTIAKSYLLPPHSQIKRIGAIYLMYGLYTQQPLQGFVKFRVTPEEWSVILKFIDRLKVNGFIDATYIFFKMCIEGAFHTVAFSREYGLERNFRKYLMPWPARDEEINHCATFSLETLMSRVYRGSLQAAAAQCFNKYNSIKQALDANKKFKFKSIEGTEKPLDQVLQEHIGDIGETSGIPEGLRKKVMPIGSIRQQLKDRAMQNQSSRQDAQSDLLSDSDNAADKASSVKDDSQNQADQSPSQSADEESEHCGEDADFSYMMKPPSHRNSRKKKSIKGGQAKRKQTTKHKKIVKPAVRKGQSRKDRGESIRGSAPAPESGEDHGTSPNTPNVGAEVTLPNEVHDMNTITENSVETEEEGQPKRRRRRRGSPTTTSPSLTPCKSRQRTKALDKEIDNPTALRTDSSSTRDMPNTSLEDSNCSSVENFDEPAEEKQPRRKGRGKRSMATVSPSETHSKANPKPKVLRGKAKKLDPSKDKISGNSDMPSIL